MISVGRSHTERLSSALRILGEYSALSDIPVYTSQFTHRHLLQCTHLSSLTDIYCSVHISVHSQTSIAVCSCWITHRHLLQSAPVGSLTDIYCSLLLLDHSQTSIAVCSCWITHRHLLQSAPVGSLTDHFQ